jgi:hypothetical protein
MMLLKVAGVCVCTMLVGALIGGFLLAIVEMWGQR